MFLPKEVLSSIPPDAFLEVGDLTLERAEDIRALSHKESQHLQAELYAYAATSTFVDGQESKKHQNPYPGRTARVGMARLGLAIREWFYHEGQSGHLVGDALEISRWLKEGPKKPMILQMRAYLEQESIHESIAEDAGLESLPYEAIAAAKDFPAFVAFGNFLEAKLADAGVEEADVLKYGRGVMLGSVALREYIEVHNFNQLVPNLT